MTSPAATSSAALVRDSPNSREIAASTRSPASPLGTCSTFMPGDAHASRRPRCAPASSWSHRLSGRVVGVDALAVETDAAQAQQDEQHRGDGDRAVGDVEDRPVRELDEVDDVAAERCRVAEDPVGDVAERAAEEEAERDRPARDCAACRPA